jgi:prepilin-type N-terminal cleavage/methylation domain-containing protein
MSAPREQGFTLVEVLFAVVMLGVGVMALVGSSAMATRMIGRGRESTQVGQVATARAEWLRQVAAATSPPCGSAQLRTDSVPGANGIQEKWVLLGAAGDRTRDVRMMYSYKVPKGTRTDTMTLSLLCK